MKQICILVLGMHRSGTSALTGVLSMLNVYLGSELLKPQSDNVKGFYENQKIVDINEKIFMHIGTYWHDLFYNERKLNLVDKVLKEELKKVLSEEFMNANIFAIKDPRLSYLFPIYAEVLKELGVDIKIILPYRNPMEVANSLHKRDGFSLEKGMLLWAYHFLLAEEYSREYNRIFVSFDKLIANPKEVIENISERLKLNLLSKYENHQQQINEFLEPSLKHNNASIDNISTLPKIIKSVLSLEENFNHKNLDNEFDTLKDELFDYQQLFYNQDLINSLDMGKKAQQQLKYREEELKQKNQELKQKEEELTKKNQEIDLLQNELVLIYTSRSWKLTRILRKLNRLVK